MKKIIAFVLSIGAVFNFATAQTAELSPVKINACTPVKDQAQSGTCWSFSTTSLVESNALLKGVTDIDLSEMYTVRKIYVEKARNYILRQGTAQFGPGGLGHDVIRSIAKYGAVPEAVYSGKVNGQSKHNHDKLDERLKQYVDSVVKSSPLKADWLPGFEGILDAYLGAVPGNFNYNGKSYTPQAFATNVLKFNPDDYVNITSFTHHPFYKPFVIEVPDNFSNGLYYNIPLDDMIALTKDAINKGFTIMWDADVSNKQFNRSTGYAMMTTDASVRNSVNPDAQEMSYDAGLRQTLFEDLTTQDDHLMHLIGLEKSAAGKDFFLVKNSWGETGPFKGYVNVSVPYFAINTVSMVVPKAALSKEMLTKLQIQ